MKLKTKIRYAEAEQFNGKAVKGMCPDPMCEAGPQSHVHTMHNGQTVDLEIGDWVFPEPIEGFYYPVKPQAFEKNWEPAE